MASAEKKVVQTETVLLSLTEREAQLILAAFSFLNDVDPDFPEVQRIWQSLKNVAPEYFGKVTIVDDSGLRQAMRFKNV